MIRQTKEWILGLALCLVAGAAALVLMTPAETGEQAANGRAPSEQQASADEWVLPQRAHARPTHHSGEDPSTPGSRRVYAFDLSSTFVGSNPDNGGLSLAGSGLLTLTVAERVGEKTLLAGQFSETQLGVSTGTVAPDDLTDAFRHDLEKPFVLSMRPTGHFDALSVQNGLDPMSYNLLRTILAGLQFVGPQNGDWKQWDTIETDHNGHYEARYQQVATEEFERTKVRYTELTSLSGAIFTRDGRAPSVSASTRFRLDDHGLVARVDTQETTTVPFGGGALRADSKLGLTLQSVVTGQVPDLNLSALVTEPLNHSRSGVVDRQERDRKLRARVAGADVHELMAVVEAVEPSEDNGPRWAAEQRLAASLELDPNGGQEIVRRLRHGVEPADAQLFLAALSDSNSGQAQAALAEIIEDPQIDPGVRSSALTHLGLSDAPTVETVETLGRLSRTAEDEQTRAEALLALGSAASNAQLQEETRGAAEDAVSGLERQYERATTQEAKGLVLSALGNAASESSRPLLQRAVSDPDPRVRASAVRALRSFNDPSVDQTLLQVLSTDAESIVREAAAKVVGRRPFSEAVGQAFERVLQSDPDNQVRLTSLGVVADWLDEHPALRLLIKAVAETDADENVRAAAERELAAHERYLQALAASSG